MLLLSCHQYETCLLNVFVFVVAKSSPVDMKHEALDTTADISDSTTNFSSEIIAEKPSGSSVEPILHPTDSSVDIVAENRLVILQEAADEESCLPHINVTCDKKLDKNSTSDAYNALELDVLEIPVKMTECPNAISDAPTLLPGNKSVESNFEPDHHNICLEERISTTRPQICSDASNCEDKLIQETEAGKDAFEYEQMIGVEDLKHDQSSDVGGSFDCAVETVEHSVNINISSGDCTVSSDIGCKIQLQNSHDGIANGICSSPQKRQKLDLSVVSPDKAERSAAQAAVAV